MPVERFPEEFDLFENTSVPQGLHRRPYPGDLARFLDNELYNDVVVTDAKNDAVRARVSQRVSSMNDLVIIVSNVDDLIYVVHSMTCGWSASVLVELDIQGCV